MKNIAPEKAIQIPQTQDPEGASLSPRESGAAGGPSQQVTINTAYNQIGCRLVKLAADTPVESEISYERRKMSSKMT